MAQNMINVQKVFSAEAILASAVAYSDPVISLKEWKPDGFFSLYLALTGAGTCKLEWLVSADGKNYLIPSGYDNVICSGFTKASGSHSIEVGDSVFIISVAGMVEINESTATVASTTATTFTTDINSAGYSNYTSGGTAIPQGKGRDADAVITGISKANPAVVTVDKGRDYFDFVCPPAPYLKIKATETGGANPIAITAYVIAV